MPTQEDPLSLAFNALADPTRRAILARLSTGEASVNELAALAPHLSLPAISKHLKVLQHAGLITQGRKAQWRPCRLEAGPLKDVAEIGIVPAPNEVKRENGSRRIDVTCEAKGRDLGSVARDIQLAVMALSFDRGYHPEFLEVAHSKYLKL